MDRILQWVWDRYGARYSWAIWAFVTVMMLSTYPLLSALVVAFENSSHYAEAIVVTGVAVVVQAYVVVRPGNGLSRLTQRWAAGYEVDRGS